MISLLSLSRMKWSPIFAFFFVGILTCRAQLEELSEVYYHLRAECRTFSGNDDLYTNTTLRMRECSKSVGESAAREFIGQNITIWKMLCRKETEMKECTDNYWKDISHCFAEEMKEFTEIGANSSYSTLSYLCHNDGERIETFINKSGPECMFKKKLDLQRCVKIFNAEVANGTALWDGYQCLIMNNFEKCIVGSLKQCRDPTPADIVSGLFQAANINTPCTTISEENAAPSGSSKFGEDQLETVSREPLWMTTVETTEVEWL